MGSLQSRIGLVLLVFVLSDDFSNLVCSEAAVHLAADSNDWSKTASTYAAETVKREEAVFGGLANLDAELALECVEDALSTADVASCTHTDRDRVFALRLHSEVAVECYNTIDACYWDVEFCCDCLLDFAWQVSEDFLALVEDGDELTCVVVVLSADDANLVEDFFCTIIFFHSDYFLE